MRALIQETHAVLPGCKISDAEQPDRWGVQLIFRKGRGTRGLLLSVKPGAPRVEMFSSSGERPRHPSRFGDLVASRIKGAVIEGIEQLGLERIVALHLKGDCEPGAAMTLYAEMLGPRANFVLVDRITGAVIGRLRAFPGKPEDEPPGRGELYRPPSDAGRVDPRSIGEEEFCGLVRARMAGGIEPARALVNCFMGFSPMMAAELVARSGVESHASPNEKALSLWKPFSDLISKSTDGRFEPRLLIGADGQPIGLAAFPLITVPADQQVPYSTMSAAAAAYHCRREAEAEQEALRADLLRRLKGEVARAERLAARLAEQATVYSQAELHELKGRLLLANRAAIRRGQRAVELPNYADPAGGPLQIELDPARSMEENAKHYFALQRKARRGTEVVRRRLADVAARLARLQGFIRESEEAEELDELRKIEAALAPIVRPLPSRDKSTRGVRDSAGPEPRTFRSSDGMTILVGKNGPGNDHLTWRLARSYDLWLHAQGIPGSHVVVRLQKGKSAPPRTLQEAAQIAAYYSRARGQVKVPVDYAVRKYLRKPKAAAPGVVLLTQEKTIVVRPDRDLVRRLHPSKTDLRAES
ncbi:MAG TPA: NFACT family protein [Candidatus Methylomirabilis sp.]|nr:NFACT family protein [Candidatus Methylomirabilis sp.]